MIKKFRAVLGCVKNWYWIPLDKILGGPDVTYKFRNGLKIRCRTKSTDINEAVVVLSGVEYPENFVKLGAGQMRTVVDLGGNIGAFALLFQQLNSDVDYYGYVFEPHPGNIIMLNANLATNAANRWTVVTKAAAGKSGNLRFDVSGGFDSFKIDQGSQNYIEVEAIRLSDFCATNGITKIDLLKMDIEGGEYDILYHDLPFLENSVDVILMEYHHLDSVRNLDYVLNRLGQGFDVKLEHGHVGGGIVSAINKARK